MEMGKPRSRHPADCPLMQGWRGGNNFVQSHKMAWKVENRGRAREGVRIYETSPEHIGDPLTSYKYKNLGTIKYVDSGEVEPIKEIMAASGKLLKAPGSAPRKHRRTK